MNGALRVDRRRLECREAEHGPAMADDASVAPIVAVRNVSKRYRSRKGEVHAVNDVSLTIGTGEFVSIVGPSGCGKSTLLNMIAVVFDYGRLDRRPRQTVRGPVHDLGIVFQQHLLLPWRTILNNVLLQIEVRRLARARYIPRAEELLARVGLRDFSDRFPDGCQAG